MMPQYEKHSAGVLMVAARDRFVLLPSWRRVHGARRPASRHRCPTPYGTKGAVLGGSVGLGVVQPDLEPNLVCLDLFGNLTGAWSLQMYVRTYVRAQHK